MKTKISLKILLTTLLIVGLVAGWTVPVTANDGPYIKMQTPFTIDKDQPGTSIEKGATIHHLANGVTEVYGADKSVKLRAKESEANMVQTPNGIRSANRVYHLPNGCTIIPKDNITQVFDDNDNLILTIIDDKQEQIATPDYVTGDWVAYTYCDVTRIDMFNAYWSVPSRPPSNDCTDFYFNGITKRSTGFLIQPVLQWNQAGNHKWQIQSWAYWPGGSATGAAYNVAKGYIIRGMMQYTNPYNGTWSINTYCNGILRSTLSIALMSNYVQRICCTLEVAVNSWDNSKLPGSNTFYNMTFTSPDTITWTPVLNAHGMTGLNVGWVNPTPVYIITPTP